MHRGKVLVIDDEPMICWSIEQTLAAAGYQVAVAYSAAEGLTAIRNFQPQLVFLDMRLPDQDGFTVLETMKKEAGKEPAVILMTAYGEHGTAEKAVRLGSCKYLEKPLDFDQLHHLVDSVLGGTRADFTGG
jgi:two-component system nitrogen regulation response regulator GlnG